jgi:hypothetical protein
MVSRQVGRAEGDTNREKGPPSRGRIYRNAAAVEFHQFLHQCQAKPGTFVLPGARAGDAMETLEQVGQFGFRDARSVM